VEEGGFLRVRLPFGASSMCLVRRLKGERSTMFLQLLTRGAPYARALH